jgi:hypothetical protein
MLYTIGDPKNCMHLLFRLVLIISTGTALHGMYLETLSIPLGIGMLKTRAHRRLKSTTIPHTWLPSPHPNAFLVVDVTSPSIRLKISTGPSRSPAFHPKCEHANNRWRNLSQMLFDSLQWRRWSPIQSHVNVGRCWRGYY